ncbi:bifunctional phosphopantothenoylcysteine decarboxylase/phosphopantothenate--cysteine ligase CoaBC [Paenibacillus sp. CAA11]|uniref:bifunctional phosphopantothenoylcysteine decarboxylase/phosphopantothenate--cysteine ligase CoaBC n=1 Tax=Paenibacillus sp. CAA11 TaxID=1532905 RepID=UPI000D398447|nr:bifunctional phosphopantothenoylcysteine decarboxylase/phosphopantothenate--cysteine ligase CoaBC [Paenibacillus sp. CAA11]AWB45167.1 bifunctional phosphopantothenoylcysteine decarboxylase/phosphopantothenate--cysteine ligase CoaBC [Paenibacillus sp. CAA11]
MLTGKRIVLGVTGGIAAFKAASLCSKLVQQGAEVRVIMTSSATKFITELTLQSLSKAPVYTDTFDEKNPAVIAHINLADWADLVLVAPATANIIGKMAAGLADDMLSTTLLATEAPIMLAPAMNVHMYQHPAVMRNLAELAARGVMLVEPGEGLLACGYVGKGRMEEPEQIVAVVGAYFERQARYQSLPLAGKKVVITAGGTIERIDPVRYITNDSSGKMGFALAEAARELGAEVRLIAGSTQVAPPPGIQVQRVQSAEDMLQAVMAEFSDSDIVIKAAAVADYRPAVTQERKIKKSGDTMTLELVKTVDILEQLGKHKQRQFLIGFAAETHDVESYAMDKLKRKNCDLIVANDVTVEGAGFGTDTNVIQVYDAEGLALSLPKVSKREAALQILELACGRLTGASR